MVTSVRRYFDRHLTTNNLQPSTGHVVTVLKFQQARETVIAQVKAHLGAQEGAELRLLPTETVPLFESLGRVLAKPVHADRDFPPFPRSTRDGFAVRSADVVADVPALAARLRRIGEAKAGEAFTGTVGPMECVEIMTGASVPSGADAVVMVEHTVERDGWVEINRDVTPGLNVVPQGSESRRGDLLLSPGRRIGYAETAMLAAVGKETVAVYRMPRVAILPTGDEVVEIGVSPGPYQIRNSNSYSLRAQVANEKAIPLPIGIAPDREDPLREMIVEGLRSNLLLLSGGVSMGKFDLVEQVLQRLDADFFFDGVAIQPGKPLVFGRAKGTFFFGLPGNPLSTMVTFELFARPALALLSGELEAPLVFLRARLSRELRRKPGLTAFLPALLEGNSGDPIHSPPIVSLIDWKGSGDVAALNRANCYLVVPEEAEELHQGDWVAVLPR
jgi:molybdopterin molybdotransferase